MKFIRITLFLSACILCFSSCEEEPTDEEVAYQLFPNGYFSTGFREEYNLTGQSQSGATFTGTHLELTQSVTSFNGQQVVPVRTQNDWDDENSTHFINGTIAYYSQDASNRTFIGSKDIITNVDLLNNNLQNIPITAKIGESGMIGAFPDLVGNTLSQSWKLQQGSGEMAWLVWEAIVRDVNGAIISEGNTSYEIEPDGTRKSITILFDLKVLADPVNWTGTKQN